MSNVHLILDEAAELGPMDAIDTAIGLGRGYGIRLQLYYQSVGQLRKCFPDGGEDTVLSNCSQIFFAVNTNDTAEYVSTRLGEETIVLNSGGTSHGTSWQSSGGAHPSDSHGGSTTTNNNWSLQARKLLKPEEVMALSPRTAITFTPGVPPICTRLLRYYEEKNLPALAKGAPPRQKHALAKAVFSLAVMLFFAVMLTHALIEQSERPQPPPANREVETRFIHPTGDDDGSKQGQPDPGD